MSLPRKSHFGPTIPSDGVIELMKRFNLTLPPNSGFWYSKNGKEVEILGGFGGGQHLCSNGVLSYVQRLSEPNKPEVFHTLSLKEIKPDNRVEDPLTGELVSEHILKGRERKRGTDSPVFMELVNNWD